jgi:hypothetical protein
MDFTWIGGPTRGPNRLKILHTQNVPKGPHGSPLDEDGGQPGPQGFDRPVGFAKPTYGRDLGIPCVISSFVQRSFPRFLSVLLCDPPDL